MRRQGASVQPTAVGGPEVRVVGEGGDGAKDRVKSDLVTQLGK